MNASLQLIVRKGQNFRGQKVKKKNCNIHLENRYEFTSWWHIISVFLYIFKCNHTVGMVFITVVTEGGRIFIAGFNSGVYMQLILVSLFRLKTTSCDRPLNSNSFLPGHFICTVSECSLAKAQINSPSEVTLLNYLALQDRHHDSLISELFFTVSIINFQKAALKLTWLNGLAAAPRSNI